MLTADICNFKISCTIFQNKYWFLKGPENGMKFETGNNLPTARTTLKLLPREKSDFFWDKNRPKKALKLSGRPN
jgi:hypothetical protein